MYFRGYFIGYICKFRFGKEEPKTTLNITSTYDIELIKTKQKLSR